jgi:hypothetical protein
VVQNFKNLVSVSRMTTFSVIIQQLSKHLRYWQQPKTDCCIIFAGLQNENAVKNEPRIPDDVAIGNMLF